MKKSRGYWLCFREKACSLRSSRFLSFSKRSQTGGKLRTPSLLLPNFLAHPRRAPSLAHFSFACSISAPPEKGKESAATQAKKRVENCSDFEKLAPVNQHGLQRY